MKRTFDDRLKKKAVLRVHAGEKLADVASDMGCAVRSLERWMKAAGATATEPAADKSKETPEADNPRLDKALSAGEDPSEGGGDITEKELADARRLRTAGAGDWCVGAVKGVKGAAITLACPMAGLDPSAPEIRELMGISPFAEEQIRCNAQELRPLLEKYLGESGGLILCALAILADVGFTGYVFVRYAKEAAAERRRKREEEKAAEEVKKKEGLHQV
jgi:hypothetical protein